MKPPKFMMTRTYNSASFWVSLGIVVVNVFMVSVFRQIQGTQYLQYLCLMNGCLGAVGALSSWIRDREFRRRGNL